MEAHAAHRDFHRFQAARRRADQGLMFGGCDKTHNLATLNPYPCR
jgi:hypothetical protein